MSWKRLEPMLSGAVADSLTGLMNRMAFERRLQEEWQRAIRTGCSVAILVVDLDHFKGINDQYGHQAGDEVIRHVAAQLECSLRSYDLVARYGGDEFTALCLGCRPGEIEIPIQRILAALNSPATARDDLPASASVSVGAAVRHDSFANSSPAELFMAADQCLYRAKQSRGTACCQEFGVSVTSHMTPIGRCDDSLSVNAT